MRLYVLHFIKKKKTKKKNIENASAANFVDFIF